MTLDEAIKHAEEVAKIQENNAKRYPRPDRRVRGSGKKYNAYLKCAEEHRQLAEWLKELKQLREQTRWIPISERLPEKNMRCLVAVGRFNFTEIATYSDLMGTLDHQIFYRGDVGHDNFKNITQYVKAWMPSPKPYESQERGDNEKELSIYNGAYIGICPNCGSEVMSGLQETECYSCGKRIILNTKI